MYILTVRYSRGISHSARPFGCIARKLADDQAAVISHYVPLYSPLLVCRCLRCFLRSSWSKVSEYTVERPIPKASRQPESKVERKTVMLMVMINIGFCLLSARLFLTWCGKTSCITPKVGNKSHTPSPILNFNA